MLILGQALKNTPWVLCPQTPALALTLTLTFPLREAVYVTVDKAPDALSLWRYIMPHKKTGFIKRVNEMFSKHRKASVVALALLCLMTALQITVINNFTTGQISDAAVYRDIARDIAEKKRFYPNEDYINSNYIFNPGYVNYLSLYYRVSQSDYPPLYGNVVLSVILAVLIFYVSSKLFDSVLIGLISVMIFAVFPSNVFEVTHMRTELPYTVAVMGAAALALSRVRGRYITAGVLIGLANFTRPLAVSFLIAIVLHMLLHKKGIRSYAALLAGAAAAVLITGAASYANTGYFIYQSTTGGYNLLIGANDDAKGNYGSGEDVFLEGNAGYLENPAAMTFKEKDDFYVSQAVKWIKENPVRYISMFPAKLMYLYATDTYAFNPVYNNEVRTGAENYVIGSLLNKILNLEFSGLGWREWLVLGNQGLYMLILVLAAVSFVRLVFIKKALKPTVMLAASAAAGTGLTILTVGGARYHYPFMPVFFIFAAALLAEVYASRLNKRQNP